jgi:HSP20 family protein
MRLNCYTPYRLIDQVHQEFDRLTNAIPQAGTAASSRWAPAFDVLEDSNNYLLRADVPGVARRDIDVRVDKSVLTIRGERKADHDDNPRGYRRRERRHGAFCREFSLPDTVDPAGISARISDGVLEITIPKQTAARPKKITLN